MPCLRRRWESTIHFASSLNRAWQYSFFYDKHFQKLFPDFTKQPSHTMDALLDYKRVFEQDQGGFIGFAVGRSMLVMLFSASAILDRHTPHPGDPGH